MRLLLNFTRKYSQVRVRFAPSPTGYLHLGGLRTALYNFLYARLNAGKFILRIEDTDQTRLVPGATKQLQDDLKWAGIEIDEGPESGGPFGPYIQSERVDLYKEQVQVLLDNGMAYRCFCTDRRLDLLRREAVRIRQVPKYDNRCRHLSCEDIDVRLKRGESHCIRFKLLPDCETFEDLIYGNIAYDVALNEGDPVILKSDGFPTYHFANVVDDHFMQISHVLRGVEWQISTTKHILMYRAFNWDPPKYGHLPLLINADGTKLSKRQGDIKIAYYRQNGVLPQAVINFITNSGGGFSKDKVYGIKPKSYSMEELIDQFDLSEINSHSGKLMPERLLEFNNLELQRQMADERCRKALVASVQHMITTQFAAETKLQIDEKHIIHILNWSLNRIAKLSDLVSKELLFLWVIPEHSSGARIDAQELCAVGALKACLDDVDFEKGVLNERLRTLAETNRLPFAKFMKLLRVVLSGLKEGPSVAEMMEILGKENTRMRLELFLNKNDFR